MNERAQLSSGIDWMKPLHITALVKHGSHFLHVLTTPITLIHCKDAMEIDTTKLPRVVENPAPGAVLTHFDLAASKQVKFGFINELLAHKCLTEAPDSFEVKCETISHPVTSTAEHGADEFFSLSIDEEGDLESRADLCSVIATSLSPQEPEFGHSENRRKLQTSGTCVTGAGNNCCSEGTVDPLTEVCGIGDWVKFSKGTRIPSTGTLGDFTGYNSDLMSLDAIENASYIWFNPDDATEKELVLPKSINPTFDIDSDRTTENYHMTVHVLQFPYAIDHASCGYDTNSTSLNQKKCYYGSGSEYGRR